MKKEIVHYVKNYENFSGAAFQGGGLAKGLNEKYIKYNNVIFNKSSKNIYKKESINGLVIYHLPSNLLARLFFLFVIFTFRKIDLVHIHGYDDSIFLISSIFNKKSFLKSTIEGEDFETLARKRGKYFLTKLSNVAHNNALATPMYEINKKYTNKISIIPNIVETIESICLDEKENLFLVVGAVCERKRTYEAIEYFINNITNEFNKAKLCIIGPDSNTYGEYSEQYISRCNDLAVGRSDIIFLGQLDKKEIPAYYRKAKGLLFFSSREGLPSVVIEAQAMSCAPIAFHDNKVIYDVISEKYNGFILNSFLQKITSDDIHVMITSNNLYESAMRYDMDRVLSIYDDIYSDILF